MSIKRRISMKTGKRSGLAPHVRSILSTGMDFFDALSHMEPIPKNKFGEVRTNLWVCVDPSPPCPSDALPGPDARLDFLREQWALHKKAVLEWHIDKNRDGSRPWGFWMWSAPEEYPPFLPRGGSAEDHAAAREKQRIEALRILLSHNLITQEEQFLIHAQDASEAELRTDGGAIED